MDIQTVLLLSISLLHTHGPRLSCAAHRAYNHVNKWKTSKSIRFTFWMDIPFGEYYSRQFGRARQTEAERRIWFLYRFLSTLWRARKKVIPSAIISALLSLSNNNNNNKWGNTTAAAANTVCMMLYILLKRKIVASNNESTRQRRRSAHLYAASINEIFLSLLCIATVKKAATTTNCTYSPQHEKRKRFVERKWSSSRGKEEKGRQGEPKKVIIWGTVRNNMSEKECERK